MKPSKRYKITIDNESRLETIASHTFSPLGLAAAGAGAAVILMLMGAAIVALTPLRELMPGYLADSQRVQTENAMLRLDSLNEVYMRNEFFLANVNRVLDTDRNPSDSTTITAGMTSLSADSLMNRTTEEARFATMMQNREKFNVSVIASMAADGMLMYPVSDEGTVADNSRDAYDVEIILPDGATVMSIADGVVIGAYYDAAKKSYVMLTQHDNGFVSRISGLVSLLVGESDAVEGGEIIARSPASSSRGPAVVKISLWHNGTPVKPYEYVAGHRYRISTDSENRTEIKHGKAV